MMSKVKRLSQFLKVIYGVVRSKNYKDNLSFSQAGEDRVLQNLFRLMKIRYIKYLEIGTNHPVAINNTYLFYVGGSRGVCIEPNPDLIPKIKKTRPEDILLNIGITGGDRESEMDFYIFDSGDAEKGLSTFSKKEAEHVQDTTHIKIGEVRKIPVTPIKNILEKYFPDAAPDLISLDVEGLDLEILKGIDFTTCRPKTICVETISFTLSYIKEKNTEIIDYMESQGYFVYAETGINSIFADKNLFRAGK